MSLLLVPSRLKWIIVSFAVLASVSATLAQETVRLLPGPLLGEDNGIELNDRILKDATVEWQFSFDGGQRWRPMIPSIGEPMPVEAQPYNTWRSVLKLPGEFIAGLSFRAKVTFVDGTIQLSDVASIPHVDTLPSKERLFTLNRSAYHRMMADSGLIVFKINSGQNSSIIETWEEVDGTWQKGPDLEGSFSNVLYEDQLFMVKTAEGGGSTGIQVYDWDGIQNGWIAGQFLLGENPSGVMDSWNPVGVSISEGRLFLMHNSDGGFVSFFEKSESGTWEYVHTLKPEGNGVWKYAYQFPLSFGDTIVTHGTFLEGYQDTFYFKKQPDGAWGFVASEEAPFDMVFKAGDYLLRVYYPFYNMEQSRKERLDLIDPQRPAGENLVFSGPFDYGFFPTEVSEEWVLFTFEPSPENWVETGAVALVPILDGEIHSKPALLRPADSTGYHYMSAISTISDSRLIFVSQMVDGTAVVEAVDLTMIPHPRFPNVDFAKWTAVGNIPEGNFVLPLLFRESARGDFISKVHFSFDQINWFEVPEDELIRSIVRRNADGDGAVDIVSVELPVQRNGRTVFYRIQEQPIIGGSP